MDSPGVLKEIDCYISSNLRKQLLLLIYKNRETHRTLEYENIKDGRIKTSLDLLELNVKDGRLSRTESIGEQSDSYLLRSNLLKLPTSLVGYFWNDECHFVPVEREALEMDTIKDPIVDKPRASESSMPTEPNTASSSADKTSGVVVSARLKMNNTGVFRGQMGGGRRKPMDNDPDVLFLNQLNQTAWRTVRYKPFAPDKAFEDRIPLLYPYEDSEYSDLPLQGPSQKNYTQSLLDQLTPTVITSVSAQPAGPSSLEELTQTIMMKAHVIRFNKLVTCIKDRFHDPHQVTNPVILQHVQKFAVLVQGWWAVKSELLYPAGTFSEHSGVPNILLVRARDYIMAVFYRGEHLTRKTISSMTKLPTLEATEILKTLARKMDATQRGHINHWEFHPADQDFIRRHPDIVQQQSTMWEARIRQLCTQLKLERLVSDGARRKRLRSGRLCSESGSESEGTEMPSLISGVQVSSGGSTGHRRLQRQRQLSLSQTSDAGRLSGGQASESDRPPPAKRVRTHSSSLPSAPMSPPPVPLDRCSRPVESVVQTFALRRSPKSPPATPIRIAGNNQESDLTSPIAVHTEGHESVLPSTVATCCKPEPQSPPRQQTRSGRSGAEDDHELGAIEQVLSEIAARASENPAQAQTDASCPGESGADKTEPSCVESDPVHKTSPALLKFVEEQLKGNPLVSLSELARGYQQNFSTGSPPHPTGVRATAPPPPGSEAERELLKGHILVALRQAGARQLCLPWPTVSTRLPEEPVFVRQVAGSECGAVCETTQQLRDAILELIEEQGSFKMGELQESLQKRSVPSIPRKTIVSMLKHFCIYRHTKYYLRLTISD